MNNNNNEEQIRQILQELMKILTVPRNAPQSKRKTKKKTLKKSRTPKKRRTQVVRQIPSKSSDKFENTLRHNTMELYLRKFEVEVLPIFLRNINKLSQTFTDIAWDDIDRGIGREDVIENDWWFNESYLDNLGHELMKLRIQAQENSLKATKQENPFPEVINWETHFIKKDYGGRGHCAYYSFMGAMRKMKIKITDARFKTIVKEDDQEKLRRLLKHYFTLKLLEERKKLKDPLLARDYEYLIRDITNTTNTINRITIVSDHGYARDTEIRALSVIFDVCIAVLVEGDNIFHIVLPKGNSDVYKYIDKNRIIYMFNNTRRIRKTGTLRDVQAQSLPGGHYQALFPKSSWKQQIQQHRISQHRTNPVNSNNNSSESLPQKRNIWLIGDSIIDNSYWHDPQVGRDNTGLSLRKMLSGNPHIEVKDYSTEEMTAGRLRMAHERGEPLVVRTPYVEYRTLIRYPYPGNVDTKGNALIDPTLQELTPDDLLVISIGGNDVVLGRIMDLDQICGNIEAILRIYIGKGIKPPNIALIIPYEPTRALVDRFSNIVNLTDLHTIIEQKLKTLGRKLSIKIISLKELNFNEASGMVATSSAGIPEPTKKGAIELAKIIMRTFNLHHSSGGSRKKYRSQKRHITRKRKTKKRKTHYSIH